MPKRMAGKPLKREDVEGSSDDSHVLLILLIIIIVAW
jgi:hypothetical protein